MVSAYIDIALNEYRADSSQGELRNQDNNHINGYVMHQPCVNRIPRHPALFIIPSLITTTTFGLVVLASSIWKWTWTYSSHSHLHETLIRGRASTQLIVHLLSSALAFINTAILCSLINFATRVYWKNTPVSLNTIRLWSGLCTRSIIWRTCMGKLLPLTAFILFTAAPASIWTGALTPVAIHVARPGSLLLPAYRNISFIKEWSPEFGAQGPLLNTGMGVFSYSAGLHLHARLITTASSASTFDGRAHQHAKLDLSHFIFNGRSYGVGVSIGLEDRRLQDDRSKSYSYYESGYFTTVTCIYNATTDFRITTTNNTKEFRAYGMLPNSGNKGPEDSPYLGQTPDAIVAIGVAKNPADSSRLLSIAAGKHYSNLNTVQCSFTFDQTRFRVHVDVPSRAATVTPLYPIGEFSSNSGNLTYALMRQFALLSSIQTTTYASTLGNAFNKTIRDYVQNSRSHGNARPAFNLNDATLPGLEAALTAMADDMLLAYAGAQMYIQQDTQIVSVTSTEDAFRIGQDVYIHIICIINFIIILFAVEEGIRTRFWRDMPGVDYLDPVALMVASVAGLTDKTDMMSVPRVGNCDGVEAHLNEDGSITLRERKKEMQIAENEATG